MIQQQPRRWYSRHTFREDEEVPGECAWCGRFEEAHLINGQVPPEDFQPKPREAKIRKVLCTKHPNYGAKRRPRSGCAGCMEAYEAKKGQSSGED